MDLLCYGNPKEKICLAFLPCKNTEENMRREEWHSNNYLRVYASDYERLLPYFKKVFPLINPTNGEVQDFFDECWENWISVGDWEKIIAFMKNDISSIKNNDEILFFNQFISWIEKQIEWADIIVIEGNL